MEEDDEMPELEEAGAISCNTNMFSNRLKHI
jgi:hypothetical protein